MGSRVQPSDTVKDAIIKIAEGNPGALSILMKMFGLLNPTDAVIMVAHLDDMDITGSLIWCAYKDVYKEDLLRFVSMIPQRKKFLKDLEACASYVMERDYKLKQAAVDAKQ